MRNVQTLGKALLLAGLLLVMGVSSAGAVSTTLVISQVFYDTPGTDSAEEWVEIYNLSATTIDLSNYKIGDEESSGGGEGMFKFPAGASIEPGQKVIVALKATGFYALYGYNPDYEISDTNPTVPDMSKYTTWASGSVALSNTSDEVLLLDGSDTVVDVVAWGGSTRLGTVPHSGVATGHSLRRDPINQDSDDCSVDFTDEATPIPHETVYVSQPVQVTSNSYYERGQSIVYDGSDYWLFYGRSASVTDSYATGNPDINDYELYYKKASSISGLASATANSVDVSGSTVNDSYLGETGAVYFDSKVWAFVTIDVGSTAELYGYYTSDGGSNWTEVGPYITDLSEGQGHHDEVAFGGELWILEGSGDFNTIHSSTPTDTGTFSPPLAVGSANGGLAHFFVDGSDLYIAMWSGSPTSKNYIYKYDNTNIEWDLVDETSPSGYYDPTLFKVGSNYVFAQAPYSGDRQWIIGWTSTSLDGNFFDSGEIDIVEGRYGSNAWVDMWPIGYTDDNGDSYLLFTSERNPSDPASEIDGNIWYLEVDWDLSRDHYTYIQEAVDSVAGSAVNVAAGTYSEDVTVNKGITLTGMNDPNGGSPAVVAGTINVTAGGATVEKLKVVPGSVTGDEAGIAVYAGNTTITDNLIDGMTGDGTGAIKGIHIYGGSSPALLNISVTDNVIRNIDNQLVGGADGIMVQGVLDGVDVTGNAIQDIHSAGWAYGIEVTPTGADPSNPPKNVLVQQNSISLVNDGSVYNVMANPLAAPYPGVAFSLDETSSGANDGDASQVTVANNSFESVPLGVVNKDISSTLDASGNWWDSNDPATVTTKVYGSVDYTPWLDDGTDTSADPGFQGDFSTLHVDDDSPQTGATGRIQEGIDTVSGSTVNVASGTYASPINIENFTNLTINGVDKNTVIVQPTSALDFNACGHTSNRKAAIRVVNSTDVTLQNMTMDFDLVKANFTYGMLYCDSTGTVHNNIVKNLMLPDAGGGYYEIGSDFNAPGYTDAARAEITISDNTFIDTGRLGVVTHWYVDATISGNTFYKTTNDFGYAIEIGGPSTAVISDNIIYGFDTPALSDGSESAGIYIENAFTGGLSGIAKNVLAQNNEIYDSQYGLWIGNGYNGFAGDVDINVTLNNNNIHNNVNGGAWIQDEDKENGSSVRVVGGGNSLINNGDYGYYIYTEGDGDITVNLTEENITGHNTGVYVEDTTGALSNSAYSVSINQSNINGNTTSGISNTVSSFILNATQNWWDAADGPSGVGPGSGDAVSTNVAYCPWLDAAYPGGAPVFGNCGGAITIIKDAIPEGNKAFDFTSTIPGGENFSLVDNGVDSISSTTFTSLSPGSYTITETVPAKWTLLGISCDLAQSNPVNVSRLYAYGDGLQSAGSNYLSDTDEAEWNVLTDPPGSPSASAEADPIGPPTDGWTLGGVSSFAIADSKMTDPGGWPTTGNSDTFELFVNNQATQDPNQAYGPVGWGYSVSYLLVTYDTAPSGGSSYGDPMTLTLDLDLSGYLYASVPADEYFLDVGYALGTGLTDYNPVVVDPDNNPNPGLGQFGGNYQSWGSHGFSEEWPALSDSLEYVGVIGDQVQALIAVSSFSYSWWGYTSTDAKVEATVATASPGVTLTQSNIGARTGDSATFELRGGDHVTCTFTNNRPNAATMSSFSANAEANQISINWVTESENDTVGFNVMRSTSANGAFEAVNTNIILAQGTPFNGAAYSYVDAQVSAGATYYYYLQELTASGDVIDLTDDMISARAGSATYLIYLPVVMK